MSHALDAPGDAWRACGTVELLLLQLAKQEQPVELWIAPITRRQWQVRSVRITVGALLSGRHGQEQWMATCLVPAASAHLSGTSGRLLYPLEMNHVDPQGVLARLQRELLEILLSVLQRDARIQAIHYPLAPLVPDLQAWELNALEGFPIVYRDGHWRQEDFSPGT